MGIKTVKDLKYRLSENLGFLHESLLRKKSRGQSERRRNGQFSGTADIQGCGHRILSGGVDMPEPHSAETLQGCDVRELRTPPLLGSCCMEARSGHLFGTREGALGYEEKGDRRLPPRNVNRSVFGVIPGSSRKVLREGRDGREGSQDRLC